MMWTINNSLKNSHEAIKKSHKYKINLEMKLLEREISKARCSSRLSQKYQTLLEYTYKQQKCNLNQINLSNFSIIPRKFNYIFNCVNYEIINYEMINYESASF